MIDTAEVYDIALAIAKAQGTPSDPVKFAQSVVEHFNALEDAPEPPLPPENPNG